MVRAVQVGGTVLAVAVMPACGADPGADAVQAGRAAVSIDADASAAGLGTSQSTPPPAVAVIDGKPRTASETAEDWATYADHVLVVTVTDEVRGQAGSKNDGGMVGRTATLKSQKVLWSAPDAPRQAPETVDLQVAGWFLNHETGSQRAWSLADTSRLEPGHTYVLALEWIDDPCSEDPIDGSWEPLGPGGAIPYEDEVLGAGEFEGRVQTVDEAKSRRRTNSPDPASLRDLSVGGTVDELVGAVEDASPRIETGYMSVPRECDRSG
jgi:hypothetical protein